MKKLLESGVWHMMEGVNDVRNLIILEFEYT